jgi:hypothetical protein
MSKFFNQLNNIKAGRAKVKAYGEGGTVDALESARDYLREKYNDPEAGIPTKVATVLGLVPVNLARSAARAVTAPTRSMTDENFNPEEEAANMAGFITTGGIALSKAGLGPKIDKTSRMARADRAYPMEGYHATTKDFDSFRPSDVGVHIGTTPTQAESRFKVHGMENARILPLRFNPGKSLRLPDAKSWEDPYWILQNPEIKEHLSAKLIDEMKNFHPKIFKEIPNLHSLEGQAKAKIEAGKITKKINKEISDKGYDSIVYSNTHDGLDVHERMAGKDSYIILNPKNIRSRFAEFNPAYVESSDIGKASGGPVLKSHGGAVHQRALGAKLFNLK